MTLFNLHRVMTIAVAEALLNAGKDAPVDRIRKLVTESMQKWGRKYPHAGSGRDFHVAAYAGQKL